MSQAKPLNTDLLITEYCLGIDLGGSSVKAVTVTPVGQTLGKFNEAFNPERPMHFAETIRTLVKRIESERGAPPDRIGLSAGELRWRGGSVTHTIKNVGKTIFEAVDIELK